ncbi:S-formylglutathione hydrolase [Paucibacter sp. Y2R2-4]|uniref:S-formylglutathione hydrolase n=1 Tax=Paucibacter sp. Y2R2-4 TaxID=2893553 RepID=UPI002961F531|nr:S-formylglutathione hydrolase [Paucibacter sp. Y2R2-4]
MSADLLGLELLSDHGCFGGRQQFYRHASREIGLPMRFALFVPPRPRGLLVFLAGLTCTEETFTMKAGAQAAASRLGLALLMPDTSPRGTEVAGQAESWDFGLGAGFYLDAVEAPWAQHWRMESYLIAELLPGVQQHLAQAHGLEPQRPGIFGHSMGGHGALTLALRHPSLFRSVSAFAPICAPMQCPWGQKAFGGYLGQSDASHAIWAGHDATALMLARGSAAYAGGILIDQGLADPFLATQLKPEAFEVACQVAGQDLTLRRHAGYDHGYYFIASFVEDHLRHHAGQLLAV